MSPRFFQIPSTTKQKESPKSFKLLQKLDTRRPRDSFKPLQKQGAKGDWRFFQATSKTRQEISEILHKGSPISFQIIAKTR